MKEPASGSALFRVLTSQSDKYIAANVVFQLQDGAVSVDDARNITADFFDFMTKHMTPSDQQALLRRIEYALFLARQGSEGVA